ncbi:unnamed protein product [Rangifer tarandus platyrhynchus]|uniref:Uncharacterized protein n=1 Tax=Rangifer tarandus platyrhynchus TaxID=3082113 RepID=A0AC59ZGM2_RANTA
MEQRANVSDLASTGLALRLLRELAVPVRGVDEGKLKQKCSSLMLYPILCDPMGYSPSSFVQGILQARILEWVAISFSRGSSRTRDQTRVSCIANRLATN